MRAAAILGLGCSAKNLEPFQADTNTDWRMGMPATPGDADAILLLGGDGTIHRHLGQLVRLRLPVLVVPAGSGNDFARALQLKSVQHSVAAWERFCKNSDNVREIDLGVIRPLDVGEQAEPAHNSQLGTRYFACVAGVGIDGEVARRANGFPRWLRGNGGYALSLIPTIFRFAPVRMKISVPNSPLPATAAGNRAPVSSNFPQLNETGWTLRSDQPATLAAFANTSTYGGGMKIAPRAKMDDGMLDVCLARAVNPLKLFVVFPTVYAGRHLGIREIEYFQTSRVHVETERPLDVYADGECVCRTPIEVSLQPKALKVITP